MYIYRKRKIYIYIYIYISILGVAPSKGSWDELRWIPREKLV